MLTATEARAKAQNDVTIFTEIRNIEDAYIKEIALGKAILALAEIGFKYTLSEAFEKALDKEILEAFDWSLDCKFWAKLDDGNQLNYWDYKES